MTDARPEQLLDLAGDLAHASTNEGAGDVDDGGAEVHNALAERADQGGLVINTVDGVGAGRGNAHDGPAAEGVLKVEVCV